MNFCQHQGQGSAAAGFQGLRQTMLAVGKLRISAFRWINQPTFFSTQSRQPCARCLMMPLKQKIILSKNHMFVCTNHDPNPSYLFFHLLLFVFIALIYIFSRTRVRVLLLRFWQEEGVRLLWHRSISLLFLATARPRLN